MTNHIAKAISRGDAEVAEKNNKTSLQNNYLIKFNIYLISLGFWFFGFSALSASPREYGFEFPSD